MKPSRRVRVVIATALYVSKSGVGCHICSSPPLYTYAVDYGTIVKHLYMIPPCRQYVSSDRFFFSHSLIKCHGRSSTSSSSRPQSPRTLIIFILVLLRCYWDFCCCHCLSGDAVAIVILSFRPRFHFTHFANLLGT